MLTIKVLESVSGFFLAQLDVPIQVWHMIEIMRRDFSERHRMQAPITENQLQTTLKITQIAEQIGIDCFDFPDSRYVMEARPVLRTNENYQNFSAARQLVGLQIILLLS